MTKDVTRSAPDGLLKWPLNRGREGGGINALIARTLLHVIVGVRKRWRANKPVSSIILEMFSCVDIVDIEAACREEKIPLKKIIK